MAASATGFLSANEEKALCQEVSRLNGGMEIKIFLNHTIFTNRQTGKCFTVNAVNFLGHVDPPHKIWGIVMTDPSTEYRLAILSLQAAGLTVTDRSDG